LRVSICCFLNRFTGFCNSSFWNISFGGIWMYLFLLFLFSSILVSRDFRIIFWDYWEALDIISIRDVCQFGALRPSLSHPFGSWLFLGAVSRFHFLYSGKGMLTSLLADRCLCGF
jgi:hypothetical protein